AMRRILAAALGADIRRVEREETGAAGAAMIAAVQLGLFPDMAACAARWVDPLLGAAETPDAALALASYGASMALIGMGPADRAQRRPLIPLLTTAKLAYDAVGAAYLSVEQISKHRAVCAWCLAASVASAAALPAALPEARAAWKALRS
ncbi:MAG: vitamin K epoxide reductase family protein, partial [Actinobacteria bacterium]|nr:vitamin K epoxide reductase family protein [Actinomycetota bacterium]